MNKHELHGGARYVGGKVEKALGDAVDSRSWQVSGVKDQVVGGAENMLGRAQSIAEDVADAAPGMIHDARERLDEAAHRTADAARRGGQATADAMRRGSRATADAVREAPQPVLIAVAAAVGGYALGWLIHGRRG